MRNVRNTIGGLGNLMFKEAFIIGKFLDGDIPDIYLQNYHLWEKHADQIKARFSGGIQTITNFHARKKVALHIRRGDYLNNSFYVDLWKTDYYKKAIEHFPGEQFIVFCRDNQDWKQDKADRQWCRDNLSPLLGENFELPPKANTEIEDFNLMASCKSVIMANSSFSWWASFIQEHEKVIAPKEWFSHKEDWISIPPHWIRI